MDSPTPANAEVSVTLGVDTHKDAHVGVALDGVLGRHLGGLSVPATTAQATRGRSGGLEDSVLSSTPEWRLRAPSARGSPASCGPRR
jgi:hypothetical protein